MPPLLIGAIAAIVLPLTYLTWAFAGADRSIRKGIRANLRIGKSQAKKAESLPDFLVQLARRATPDRYRTWLDKNLAGAGRPKGWPLNRVLVMKPVLALFGLALGLLLLLGNRDAFHFLLLIAIGTAAYFVPDILLKNSAQKRRQAMQIALPNILDQMLISVEAGVGFEGAVDRAAQNSTGPLADEFVRTLQDIQVGRARRDAYLDLAERAAFPELRSFVRAVVQADQYGIAIANVLRSQALEMRTKRSQRAEEHAMKIPVKILFPLIFSILPALFIIVLGPTILSIFKLFS